MLAPFPHPDARVLHAPGVCVFCDRLPDWQHLRHLWGLAFTGKPEYGKIHCLSSDPLRLVDPDPANAAVPPRG